MVDMFRIIVFISFFFISNATYLTDSASGKEKDIILIAAASNLKFAMDDLILDYKNKNPERKIKIVYGSSGNFFNQILNGAPFDLYFSADARYPYDLVKRGLARKVTNYALGRIVVMTRLDSTIEIQKAGLTSLFHPTVKKIAIANPVHAPYGSAAVAFMKGKNIYNKLKNKLVYGENISQAAQFVESGAAEIGIIALSIAFKAKELGRVSYREIATGAYPPIEQGFVVLKSSKNYFLAEKFTDYLQSMEGKGVLLKYGFDVP